MSNINDRTVIPLSWFFICLSSVIVPTAVASFWIANVNNRLARIEAKLGVVPVERESISDKPRFPPSGSSG